MTDGFGILAFGAYVPRYRLRRETAADANGWFAPGLRAERRGRRSFCNWDEDALTMAVEAARACLGEQPHAVDHLALASTSLPFADRGQAGLVADALRLGPAVSLAEHGGSRRAASAALARALAVPAPGGQLLVASECLDARPASLDELRQGHAAAALLLGEGRPVATLLGAATQHQDLVDRYRETGAEGDYVLEERWVRDEAYRGFVQDTLRTALTRAGVEPGGLDHLVLPLGERAAAQVARALGAPGARRPADLEAALGLCGAAQPLLGLVAALEAARPGDTIALLGFGQGADALVLRCTEALESLRRPRHVGAALEAGIDEENYVRYLGLRGLLRMERGIRWERDSRTAQSVAYRKRAAVTGFLGGRCSRCGTLQFPAASYCVECRERGPLEPESLAELTGQVKSFTEDWQAATPRPPLMFGSVGFPGGAGVVMEFTDAEPGSLQVGDAVCMRFRIKDLDERRGFRRYFWKSAPVAGDPARG